MIELDKNGVPYPDFIIDAETFSNKMNTKVVDMSCVVFINDPHNPPTFQELIARGIRAKFDLRAQSNRAKISSTIAWWKQQSEAARRNLIPTKDDVTIPVGTKDILDFLSSNGIHYYKSQMWSRGNSFDIPIFTGMIAESFGHDWFDVTDDYDSTVDEAVQFGKHRDIRTAIEYALLSRNLNKCPLPKGTLDGFVAHDSIHDCAKDVLMLIYAQRYAMGLEEMPSVEDADPNSL